MLLDCLLLFIETLGGPQSSFSSKARQRRRGHSIQSLPYKLRTTIRCSIRAIQGSIWAKSVKCSTRYVEPFISDRFEMSLTLEQRAIISTFRSDKRLRRLGAK